MICLLVVWLGGIIVGLGIAAFLTKWGQWSEKRKDADSSEWVTGPVNPKETGAKHPVYWGVPFSPEDSKAVLGGLLDDLQSQVRYCEKRARISCDLDYGDLAAKHQANAASFRKQIHALETLLQQPAREKPTEIPLVPQPTPGC